MTTSDETNSILSYDVFLDICGGDEDNASQLSDWFRLDDDDASINTSIPSSAIDESYGDPDSFDGLQEPDQKKLKMVEESYSSNSPREDELIQSISQLKVLMNSGDTSGIHSLLDDICSSDTCLTLYYLGRRADFHGVEFAKEYLTSCVDSFPDWITIHKSVRYNRSRGIILCQFYGSMTHMFENPFMMRLMPKLSETFLASMDEAEREHFDRAQQIKATGGKFQKTVKGYHIFMLNADRSHVKQIIFQSKLIGVEPAPEIR
jgi:hypothetical protein